MHESQLPTLTDVKTSSSTTCVALSRSLLLALKESFGNCPLAPILSVGSGSGLLEAFLVAWGSDVVGTDLAFDTNRYLPPQRFIGLRGTWDSPPQDLLALTRQMLFAYPKPVGSIMRRYIAAASRLECIVWIGPATDWPEALHQLHQLDPRWSSSAYQVFGVTEPYERFMVLKRYLQPKGSERGSVWTWEETNKNMLIFSLKKYSPPSFALTSQALMTPNRYQAPDWQMLDSRVQKPLVV